MVVKKRAAAIYPKANDKFHGRHGFPVFRDSKKVSGHKPWEAIVVEATIHAMTNKTSKNTSKRLNLG